MVECQLAVTDSLVNVGQQDELVEAGGDEGRLGITAVGDRTRLIHHDDTVDAGFVREQVVDLQTEIDDTFRSRRLASRRGSRFSSTLSDRTRRRARRWDRFRDRVATLSWR